MKKATPKLALRTQTVRTLTQQQLTNVQGGDITVPLPETVSWGGCEPSSLGITPYSKFTKPSD